MIFFSVRPVNKDFNEVRLGIRHRPAVPTLIGGPEASNP